MLDLGRAPEPASYYVDQRHGADQKQAISQSHRILKRLTFLPNPESLLIVPKPSVAMSESD
jgi:hypothetical protein